MLKHGDQTKLAKKLGLSTSTVNDILTRRKSCPPKRARAFADALHELGVEIDPSELVFNKTSEHPVFDR